MFWSVDAWKSPSPQTLLARLPSRLFDRTDSTDLLIRNRHLARDPPRLPKDAPEWSFVQCHETQPRPVGLSNLDLQTSHLAVTMSFRGAGDYMHSLELKYNVCVFLRSKSAADRIRTISPTNTSDQRRELPVIFAALVKQITWKSLQP